MPDIVDLRSDTVTRPTPAMRRVMAEAEVGDDVFGEDPTVRRLEERSAELLGKPAAVYVASGTMANQIALNVHARPGSEVLCDERSHIVQFEMGMAAQLSGLLFRTIPTEDGLLDWREHLAPRVRAGSDHYRGTGLITVENTHNMAGGRVYPPQRLAEIAERAHERGIPVHMDGARVFNAAEALGLPVAEVVAPVDSVAFCLSKGLGAPVGSMLVGAADFIEEARLVRKGLGGGMRQAGVIAAAALVALEESPKGLRQAHADARFLADAIRRTDGVELDPDAVETNIVFFRVTAPGVDADAVRARMKERGVLVSGAGPRIRMLTHHDVDRSGCERAVEALREALAAEPRGRPSTPELPRTEPVAAGSSNGPSPNERP
jgi:threonine aldolase